MTFYAFNFSESKTSSGEKKSTSVKDGKSSKLVN